MTKHPWPGLHPVLEFSSPITFNCFNFKIYLYKVFSHFIELSCSFFLFYLRCFIVIACFFNNFLATVYIYNFYSRPAWKPPEGEVASWLKMFIIIIIIVQC